MVLIPNAMVGTLHGRDSQFPVFTRDWNQFASRKFFGSAALVGIDMRGLGAYHRMIGIGQGLKTETIGCGAVEHHEDVNIGAKMLLKFAYYGLRIRVISVSNRMTLVGSSDGFQDFGMDASIVVAGKAATRFHGGNNVAEAPSGEAPTWPA